MDIKENMEKKYYEALSTYLKDQNEQALYQGQKISRLNIKYNISPEEIISMHKNNLIELYPDLPVKVMDSFDFLLEVMMGYGIAYREHQSLRHQQQELKTEIEIAKKCPTYAFRNEDTGYQRPGNWGD